MRPRFSLAIYISACPSVRRSVGRSVGNQVFVLEDVPNDGNGTKKLLKYTSEKNEERTNRSPRLRLGLFRVTHARAERSAMEVRSIALRRVR